MEVMGIINIGVEHIHPHPDNPRKDLGDLSELTESIKKSGIMQNLSVIPMDDDYKEFTVIIGHRRLAAAKAAGLKQLPCRIIEGMSMKEQVGIMLEENMQRNDLTIWEQAQGFQMMMDLGESEDSIAEKTGFSRTTIRHRLNIAKLDQKLLKEKEKSEMFQLSLKDLYELEKIEDIETRDKILREANSSRDLVWRAQNAAAEEKRKKAEDAVAAILKAKGLKRAPKAAENEMYSGKWETLKSINLDAKIPKTITFKESGELFFLRYYREIRIIRKAEKGKKQKSEHELQRERIDRSRKKVKAMLKEMDKRRREFIGNILSGRIDPLRDTADIQKEIWDILVDVGTYTCMSSMTGFFMGKHDCDCKPEEREEVRKKVAGCSLLQQMLIILNFAMENNIGYIIDYNGIWNEDNAGRMQRSYRILERYGWSFEEGEEQLLDGTHELYVKKDE